MKTTLKKILAMLALAHFLSPAQSAPLFKDVVRAFFTRYSFSAGEENIVFQKKKEGWFTAVVELANPGSFHNEQIFWSAQDKEYKPQAYPLVQDTANTSAAIDHFYSSVFYDEHMEYEYDRNAYFGYTDWDKDIISDFASTPALSDTLLESLGRAYSHRASDCFSGATPTITDKDNFISFETKAIDTYRRLLQQQPLYNTFVGNIRLKYAHEYMFANLLLQYNGFEKEAGQFLPRDIYPDSMLNTTRNIVSSVSKDGILITRTDNDTYPLWYLQQTENYRPDVIIINYPLLGERKYLSLLDRRYNGRLFRTRAAIYQKQNFDYAMFDKFHACRLSQPLGPVLDSINTSDKIMAEEDNKTSIFYNDSSRKFHCKDLFLPIPKPAFTLHLKMNDYILINDFMLLDILNTNIGRRSFYFSRKDDCWFLEKDLKPSAGLFTLAP